MQNHQSDKPPVTIKDIADILDVSMTTVSKSLRGLSGVGAKTRQRVIEKAEEMGYRPNLLAQALAGTGIRFVYIYSRRGWFDYGIYLERGMKEAQQQLSDYRITIEKRAIDSIFDIEAMKQILEEVVQAPPDGLIMCGITQQGEYAEHVQRVIDAGIPVLFATQGMRDVKGIGTIEANRYVIGAMAAELLNMNLQSGQGAALITSNKDFAAQIVTLRGFQDMLAPEHRRNGVAVYENHDIKDITYLITEDILRNRPDIGSIFITSFNAAPICQCINDMGMQGRIKVISQEITPEIAEKLESGELLATIFQNQVKIGRLAIRQLLTHVSGILGDKSVVMTPHLIMRSNLNCYAHLLHAFDTPVEVQDQIDDLPTSTAVNT